MTATASTLPNLSAPSWELSNAYPGPDSPEVKRDLERARDLIGQVRQAIAALDDGKPDAARLAAAIGRLNEAYDVAVNVATYASCLSTADAEDSAASRLDAAGTDLMADFEAARVRLPILLARLEPGVLSRLLDAAEIGRNRFFLEQLAEEGRHTMSLTEEELALELGKYGLEAWRRLYRQTTARLTFRWKDDRGEPADIPVSAAIGYLEDPDREARRGVALAVKDAYLSRGDTLAIALNAITGSNLSLARRRGDHSPLDGGLRANRIERPALEAMWAAVRRRLPDFRLYLKAKARALGVERAAAWDFFAPVPGAPRAKRPYPDAYKFVVDTFRDFHPPLADFTRLMDERRWIDAEQRKSKAPGGYQTELPLVKEPRIFMNYGGGSNAIATLAHELGHAWHYWLMRDLPYSQRRLTMPLAETASTFAETVVTERTIKASSGAERLQLLSDRAFSLYSILPMILARFEFEEEVYRRRAGGELDAAEFYEISRSRFEVVHGDQIDPESVSGHAWIQTLHHYLAVFYNYPYSFGNLLSLGLYGLYLDQGESFIPKLEGFLSGTGMMGTEDLARSIGIDLEGPGFWDRAVDTAVGQIREFAEAAGAV